MPLPLRWGILGAARINRRFVPGLKDVRQTIAIIGSRDRARAEAAAAEHGAERAGTYEEVLNAPDVDVVYIPLANSLHRPWTLRAAEAGKHVLCEKPLAPNPADCATMVAAAERHGVHLVEAFMYRYHPQWKLVWQVVEAGTIGPIQMLRAAFQFPLRDRTNVRLSAELQGGALQDVGCYCVNVARWFLGEPSRVRGIAADRQGVGVDTHSAAVLEFPSGALALLSCSFETTGRQVVELIGDRGLIEVRTPFTPTGDCEVRIVDGDGERIETVPAANAYGLEARAMEKLIREGTPVLTPASDAAKTQEVIAAWKAEG
jgi:predicted dehydrogenase